MLGLDRWEERGKKNIELREGHMEQKGNTWMQHKDEDGLEKWELWEHLHFISCQSVQQVNS